MRMLFKMLVLVILNVVAVKTKKAPGLKARVTSNGLKYANKIAMDIFSKSLQGQTIPDQEGSRGSVKYWLSKMKIEKFTAPTSDISFKAPGLTWTGKGANIYISGDFRYEFDALIVIKDHGSMDMDFLGLSFDVVFKMGVNNGRPTIKVESCASNIGKVDVTFHGGASWIYNLFKHVIGGIIKNALDSKMCTLLRNYIDHDGAKALARLKVEVPIGKVFVLDYSMINSVFITQDYMDTFHKGEVYWKAGKHSEAPFQPPAIPEAPMESTRMMYIWMTNYIINTLMYQAHTHQLLTFNLTSSVLPPQNRGVLNTTCSLGPCIGGFIPVLSRKYPNHTVELRMATSAPPNISLVSGQVAAKVTGKVVFQARKDNNPLVNLFTTSATSNINVILTVKNQEIFSKPGNLTIKLKVEKSEIGDINEKALQFLADTAIIRFVKPTLERLGAKGFPLPVTDTVQFTNTQLALKDNALIIATDIQYKPLRKNDKKDTTLFFVSGNKRFTKKNIKFGTVKRTLL